MHYLFLALAIVSEVLGTTALNASQQFSRPLPSLLTVVGYGLGFYFFSFALRVIPVGVAYAIWAGVGVVLVALIGVFFFHQRLDLPAVLGMVLIVAGVLVMQLFSKTITH